MKYDAESFAEQIGKLLKDKECDTVEFKSALGGFPKSFWGNLFCLCKHSGRDNYSWDKRTPRCVRTQQPLGF